MESTLDCLLVWNVWVPSVYADVYVCDKNRERMLIS